MKYKNEVRKERRGRNERGVRREDKGSSEGKEYGMDGEK